MERWKSRLTVLREKGAGAAPVILFFLFLFYTVVLLFGTRYVILVSVLTTTFKLRHQKPFSPRGIARLVAAQWLLCLLGVLAGWSVPLCALLNAAVPFLLVYLHSTQFEPSGYFIHAMGFVFLQLRPVPPADFPMLMGAVCYSELVLVAALFLYGRVRRAPRDYRQARQGLRLLGDALARAARGEESGETLGALMAAQQSLHRLAYGSRSLTYVARGPGQVEYMFALLLQRGAYFLTDFSAPEGTGADREALRALCALLGEVEREMNTADNSALLARLERVKEALGGLTPRLQIFARNFLHLLHLTLAQMAACEAEKGWRVPRAAHPLLGVRQRLRPERFEVRFALRLSLVLTAGFLFCRLTGGDHSYWLPLNAFLVLQPMYEDSAYRMKTRVAGTALGALLCFAVLPRLPGVPGHFVFATAMVSLMYCCTPGKWVQPIFSTGFALSLASLTMDSASAVELRLLYLALAVLLVLAVNRFFFPTSRAGQFKDNLFELFRIQRGYLDLLTGCTWGEVEDGAVSALLNHFHLVCGQVRDYAGGLGEDGAAFCQSLVELMWRMAAEVEQMVFLMRSGQAGEGDRRLTELFSLQMRESLENLPRGSLECPSGLPEEMASRYLRHLAGQYDAHLYELSLLWAGRPASLGA